MRKVINKRFIALFIAAVMGGSLCADMTVSAEEVTDQEAIISETGNQEDTVSEEEKQIIAEPELETDDSEEPLEELPEMTPDEKMENVQVENENNELEEKPITVQSNAIFLQSIGGKCGENLTWSFDEVTGTLTISGTGDMDDYYDDDSPEDSSIPWLGQCEQISKVILEDGITNIGNYSFAGCNNLKEIEIPSSVTEIGERTFYTCTSLQNIMLPDSVIKIGVWAFGNCTSLKNIMISDSVTEIEESAFRGCSSLESITIPRGLETLGSFAFSDNENLESINVADGNLNYVSQDGVLYNKDKTVLELYPEGRKTARFNSIPNSVTEIAMWAFSNNVNLEEVVLPEGLKVIDSCAFIGCEKLMALTIPKSVSTIDYLAYGYKETHGTPQYPNVKIRCYANTAGYQYAIDYKFSYELLDSSNSSGSDNANSVVKVSKITISGISKKIAAGKKIKLTAKVSPSKATNKAVKWTSSNKKVATVNKKGIVTINKKAAGKSVTITAAATDGSKKKATYKISVMKGVVKKVAISGKKSVKAGKTLKLKAKVTATKKANKTLKWTSSNKKYATVNSSGKVKTYKAGKGKKVKITAEATDGSGKKKTVTIKIK